MLDRYKFRNWKNTTPQNLLEYIMTPCGIGLKLSNFFFQKILRINGNFKIMVHYTSQVNGSIKIGRNVVKSFANSGSCYFQGINGIIIGDNTIFAPGVKVISANHNPKTLSNHNFNKPITIGNNCWLGANSIVLPGVSLGDNVIVGAGAVVTRSYGDNVVLVGVPAKPLKNE